MQLIHDLRWFLAIAFVLGLVTQYAIRRYGK